MFIIDYLPIVPNNWRSLLTLSVAKILSKLHKIQDAKAIKVIILEDTVEDKVGKDIEGSCDKLWSNKERKSSDSLSLLLYSNLFKGIFSQPCNVRMRKKDIKKFYNSISFMKIALKIF